MESRSLLLVRHGQASFGKNDYDNLSERGHEQAFLLGQSLAQRGIRPERIVCGTMKRHRQTVAEIAAGAGWDLSPATAASDDAAAPEKSEKPRKDQEASVELPEVLPSHRRLSVEPRIDARWDELDHTALLTAYRPAYKNMLLLKADMVRTLRPRIAFEDTYEKAVDRWSSREHDDDYPETFQEFTGRIEDALKDVATGPATTTLVVTSSGPVCWAAAHLSAADSLDAWKRYTLAIVNTGMTRISIDRHGPHVLTFNEFAHLDAAGIVTNR